MGGWNPYQEQGLPRFGRRRVDKPENLRRAEEEKGKIGDTTVIPQVTVLYTVHHSNLSAYYCGYQCDCRIIVQ